MENKNLSVESIKFIISILIERANEAKQEYQSDKDNEFESGRAMAYYEILDILKTELDLHNQDLKEFGLDINLESTYL